MTIYLIKTIAELLVLTALYQISRKQNRQEGRITILEGKAKYPLLKVKGTFPSVSMTPAAPVRELPFKSKVEAEKRRVRAVKSLVGTASKSSRLIAGQKKSTGSKRVRKNA